MKKGLTKLLVCFLGIALAITPASVGVFATGVETSAKITLTEDMVYDEEIVDLGSNYAHSAKFTINEQAKMPNICPAAKCSSTLYLLEDYTAYNATYKADFENSFIVDLKAYYDVTNIALVSGGTTSVIGGVYVGDFAGWTQVSEIDLSVNCYKQLVPLTIDLENPTRFIRIVAPPNQLVEIAVYGTFSHALTADDIERDGPSVYTGEKENLTAGQIIGANVFIDNHDDAFDALGGVREYHNLSFSLDDEGNSRFNPSWAASGGWNFDSYYKSLFDRSIDIVPCLQMTSRWIYGEDYNPKLHPINRPSNGAVTGDNPADYSRHANVLYNFAARYGSNSNIDTATLSVDAGQEVKTGLGYMTMIENGNEQNKNWNNYELSNVRAAYSTPYEYAAQTSADYDGHEGTIPYAGVKTADPNMKLAMMGMVGGNVIQYLDGMKRWFSYNRSDRYFAVDSINYHSYITADDFENAEEKYVGAPEYAQNWRGQMREVTDWVNTNAPGREIWLSEFNVYMDDYEKQSGIGIVNQNANEPYQIAYAQRMARAFMVGLGEGIDRLSMFQLRDESSGVYSDMGLVWSYGNETKKLAWYYVSAEQEALKNSDLIDVYESDNLYKYTFRDRNTSQITYALWSPTSDGTAITDYSLNVGTSANNAELIVPEYGYSEGEKSNLEIVSGNVSVDVDETIRFVKVSGSDIPLDNLTVKRIVPDKIQLGPSSATKAKVVYDSNEIYEIGSAEAPNDWLLGEFYKLFDEQDTQPLSLEDNQVGFWTGESWPYGMDWKAAPSNPCVISPENYSNREFPYDVLVALDDTYTISGFSIFDGQGSGNFEIYDYVSGDLIYSSNLPNLNYIISRLETPVSTNCLRVVKHSDANVGELNIFGTPTNSKVGYTAEKTPYVLTQGATDVYWINFNTNGGSTIPPLRNISAGSTITLPSDPRKEGFVFGGWYTDSNFTAAFDSRTPINQNYSLNAKWNEASAYTQLKLYPSMLDSSGGLGLIDEQGCLDAGGSNPTKACTGGTYVFDLQHPYNLQQISIFDSNGMGTFSLWGSNDNENWTVILSDVSLNAYNIWKDYALSEQSYRYIKTNNTSSINELLVYAYPTEAITDTFTVNFDATGGTCDVPSIDNIAYGDTISMPTPERYGYIFYGWYSSPTGTTEITENTPIIIDMQLYAKWQPAFTFDINFVTYTDQQVAPISGICWEESVTLPTPVRNGYKFIGWYTEPEYITQVKTDEAITENLTLYARWGRQIPLTADMLISGNSTIFAKLIDSQITSGHGEYASISELAGENFVIDLGSAYNFGETAVMTRYGVAGSDYTISAGMAADDLTDVFSGGLENPLSMNSFVIDSQCRYLKLNFTFEVQEIYLYADVALSETSFNANGGLGTVPESIIYSEGITVSLPSESTELSKYGYNFIGWSSQPDATVAETDFTVGTEDTVLYAVWEEIPQYTLTLDTRNGGSATGAGTYFEGTEVTVTAGMPQSGYRFAGWKNSNGELISINTEYTFEIMGNASLTAVYESTAIGITVTVKTGETAGDTTGGSATPSSAICNPGDRMVLRASAADGYRFDGWYIERCGDTIKVCDSATFVTNIAESTEFTARFVPNTLFKVEFVGESGRILEAYTVAAGTALTLPEGSNAAATGKSFIGWYTVRNGGISAVDGMIVNNDIRLYARYLIDEAELYQITVSGGTVNGSPSAEVTYGTVVCITPNYADIPSGKVFAYWQKNGKYITGSEKYIFAATGDAEIIAVYADAVTEMKPAIQIFDCQYSDNTIYYTIERSMTVGCQFVEAGMLLTKSSTVGTADRLVAGENGVVKVKSIYNKATGTTVQRVHNSSGETVYARVYLTYINAAGNLLTVYSDITEI